MRIVLDTNVLVSALIAGGGPPGRVLAAIRRERLTLVTSEAQLAELRTVLTRDRLRPYLRSEDAEDLSPNFGAFASNHLLTLSCFMVPMLDVNSMRPPRAAVSARHAVSAVVGRRPAYSGLRALHSR